MNARKQRVQAASRTQRQGARTDELMTDAGRAPILDFVLVSVNVACGRSMLAFSRSTEHNSAPRGRRDLPEHVEPLQPAPVIKAPLRKYASQRRLAAVGLAHKCNCRHVRGTEVSGWYRPRRACACVRVCIPGSHLALREVMTF